MSLHRLARKSLAMVAMLFAVSLSPTLLAQDLQAAKEAGYVGEQRNGYLGLVDTKAPSAVQQLIQQVNAERRRSYAEIAAKNRIELNKVELLAAEKALQKTPAGQFIQDADGRWVRK